MAKGFGIGWMPGIIVQPPDPRKDESTLSDETAESEPDEQPFELRTRVDEIAKEQKKYYVVFDERDQKPEDPLPSNLAHHQGLHPYEFCVLLDETLPSPEGLPHVIESTGELDRQPGNIPAIVWDDSVWCPDRGESQWRLGWAKGVDPDNIHCSVVLQGECEMLKIHYKDCCPVKRPPVMSKDTPFDLSLVWREGFVLHANNDGLKGWTRCEVTGFKDYRYRIQITDTRESYSTVKGKFDAVEPSELWLNTNFLDTLEQDKPDAADTTMNEVQTDATDTVQDLAGAAENIDLNQFRLCPWGV